MVSLLSSQTTALQIQAAKALGSLAADGVVFVMKYLLILILL